MYPNRERFSRLFPNKPIIGMIHLKPLPGAPAYEGKLHEALDSALQDTDTLEQGGVDAIMIENFFDSPFFKDQVGPETVAAMTRIITAVRQQTSLPLGVNVLRNDGISAIAIATACDCQFIRVNVLSWAMLADQGIIEGKAAQILRFRHQLLSDEVLIFADCLTKHAVPLAPQPMDVVAMDTWERGGADALVISGVATGKETDRDDVIAARRGAPNAPILIGSGLSQDSAASLLEVADGAIVGTYFKRDGRVENPVDLDRVRVLVSHKNALYTRQ
jgi:membrane complex biogenesis BtpA family protein